MLSTESGNEAGQFPCWNCWGSGAGEGRAYNIHKIAGMQASVIYISQLPSECAVCVSTAVLAGEKAE